MGSGKTIKPSCIRPIRSCGITPLTQTSYWFWLFRLSSSVTCSSTRLQAVMSSMVILAATEQSAAMPDGLRADHD